MTNAFKPAGKVHFVIHLTCTRTQEEKPERLKRTTGETHWKITHTHLTPSQKELRQSEEIDLDKNPLTDPC